MLNIALILVSPLFLPTQHPTTPSTPKEVSYICLSNFNQSNWNVTTNPDVNNITFNQLGYVAFMGVNGHTLTADDIYNLTNGLNTTDIGLMVGLLFPDVNFTQNFTKNVTTIPYIVALPTMEIDVGFMNGTIATYDLGIFGGGFMPYNFEPSIDLTNTTIIYNSLLLNQSQCVNFVFTDVDFISNTSLVANVNWSISLL